MFMSGKNFFINNIYFDFRYHGYRSNGIRSSNWTKTAGYTKNITSSTYPKRVYSTREKLVVILKLNTFNFDNLFPQQGRGFKVNQADYLAFE